ncbi:MAG: hypothetical protein CMJ83_15345 [Planctomycetes bacterium]|nr:hypothetical protein [Planctomycetota bacterium]
MNPGGRRGVHRELVARVCVVGAGAGGAVAAAELAQAGIDTVLLEGGSHHDPATFDGREDSMMSRLYADGGQQLTQDQSMAILSGRGLGGSTVHNTGLCVPPPEAVCADWEKRGALLDGARGLLSAAAEVMARMGAVLPRDDEVNRNNRILAEGAAALGLETVRPHHNRRDCCGCGGCIVGCATNAKRNVLFSHLEGAATAGLRIVTRARIARVRRAGAGAFEVTGPNLRVRAETVVLAASALQTPVLLLRSGLGPRRLIGRTLRLHPFAPVAAVFDEPVHAWRGVPQTVLVTAGARFLHGERGGFVLMPAPAGPGAVAAFVPGHGRVVTAAMQRLPRLAVAGVLLHDENRGRVRARRDGRPSVRAWPDAFDQEGLHEGIRMLGKLFFAAGARQLLLPFRQRTVVTRPEGLDDPTRYVFRPYETILSSVHPQGTAPMGITGAAPVTPEGEVRGARGLFVADGSLFPTSVGVPPQVTIMALATQVARGLVARLT